MIIPINIPDSSVQAVIDVSCIVHDPDGPGRVTKTIWLDREKLEQYRGEDEEL